LGGRPNQQLTTGATGGSNSISLSGTGGMCSDEGACGKETLEIKFDAPNVYFVIDASGSMADVVPGKGGKTRYQVVRDAAIGMVKSVGSLINVGAALFPSVSQTCKPGVEVMPVMPGDPVDTKGDGPTLTAFKKATNRVPLGGTPTSGTLEAIRPKVAALKGKTVVLLLTDGGPNCNPNASCAPTECMAVIEGQCKPTDGCCEPNYPNGGPALCVDRPATVAAVKAIHDLGIDVYVIGVADLQLYKAVLDEMAVAGGAPKTSGPTKYTAVDDLDQLGQVLGDITAQAINCDIKLSKPPADQSLTNVYFDCDTVLFDPMNGWSWTGDDTISLRGAACTKLKAGAVQKVRVITGCPTETPK
jgi:hypothetical protein